MRLDRKQLEEIVRGSMERNRLGDALMAECILTLQDLVAATRVN